MRGRKEWLSAWRSGCLTLASGLVLVVVTPADARLRYLDNGKSGVSGLHPVSGAWNLTDPVWTDAGDDGHTVFAPGDVAVLPAPQDDAPVVLTLDATIPVGGIYLQGGNYRLTGGELASSGKDGAVIAFGPPPKPFVATEVAPDTALPETSDDPQLRLYIDSGLRGTFLVQGLGVLTYGGTSATWSDISIDSDAGFIHLGQTKGVFENAGFLGLQGRHDGTVRNNGAFNLSGVVTGTVENDGHLGMGGEIGGDLTNRGTANIAGHIGGSLSNAEKAVLSISGDLTLSQLENAGTTSIGQNTHVIAENGIINSGGMNLAGHVTGDVTQRDAGRLRLTGRVEGDLTNDGVVDLAGRVDGRLTNLAKRTATLTGDLTVGDIRNDGVFRVGADQQLTTDSLVSTGRIENDGRITGTIDNRGDLVSTGHLDGRFLNAAVATVSGQAGEVENTGAGVLDVKGATQFGQLTNKGLATVAADARLTVKTPVQNQGTLRNDGVLAGDVVNEGQLDSTGTLEGGLTNRGTAALAGMAGRIENTTGARLALTADLTADRLDNAGQAEVAAGTTLTVKEGAVNTGNLDLSGGLSGTLRNDGKGYLGMAGGRVIGTLTNDGTIGVSGQSSVTGDLVNRGALIQKARETVLRVTGLFRNAGKVSDGGQGRLRIIADQIVLEEGARLDGTVDLSGRVRNDGTMRLGRESVIADGLINGTGGELWVRNSLSMRGSDLDNGGQLIVGRDGVLMDGGIVTNTGLTRVEKGGSVTARQVVNKAGGRLVNGGKITGPVENAGNMTNRASGVIDGDLVNSGQLVSDGRITGRLENTGTAALSGRVETLVNKQGGGAQTRGDLRVDSLTNDGNLVVRRGHELTAATGIVNRGKMAVTGRVAGHVTNRGNLVASGVIAGNVTNSGTLTSRRRITGDLTNAGRANLMGRVGRLVNDKNGDLVVGGDLGLDALTGREGGKITVTGDGILRVDNTVENHGTMVNDGSLNAGIRNTGNLSGRGRFSGDLDNDGLADLSGRVAGNLVNSGNLTLRGGVIQGDLTNRGTARLSGLIGGGFNNEASGRALVDADLSTGQLVNRGSVWVQEGAALRLRDGIRNYGDLTSRGRIEGHILNDEDAVLRISGRSVIGAAAPAAPDMPSARQVSASGATGSGPTASGLASGPARGGLHNDGLLTLTNGVASDEVIIEGGLTGNGRYRMDVDLANRRSDHIIVRNGAVTGNLSFGFDVVSLDPGYRVGTRVKVLDIDGAFRKESDFTYRFDPVGAANERIVYSLDQDARSGDLMIVSQTNPAIGALFGNIALTQSLIGSVINRPSSPYVVGLATEPGEEHCGPGAWGRAVGGRADVSGSTGNGINRFGSNLSASYSGLQVGGDLACIDRPLQGWNIAVGAIAGVNTGHTNQPVYAIDPSDSSHLTSVLASTTRADFTQSYAGLYISATRGQWSADLQYRHENTDFDMRNTPHVGAGLGLTDSQFSSNANTLSGSLSYSFLSPDMQWQVVPTAGFAVTRSSSGLVTFDDGYRLDFHDNTTRVGFAGISLSHTNVRSSGDAALTSYATATIYRDFSGSMESVFSWEGHPEFEPQLLSSDHLNSYAELSVGANYLKVLGDRGARAPRQFSASGRIDLRRGGQLKSIGLSGQVRWQF